MTTNDTQAPSTHEDVLYQIGRLSRAERFRPAPWLRLTPMKTTWLDRLLWRLLSTYRCDACGREVTRIKRRAVVKVTNGGIALACPHCVRKEAKA